MAIEFHKMCVEVTSDMSMPGPACKLYNFLLGISNIKTGETPPIYIWQIAEKYGRSERTVQFWLAYLIEKKYIIRVFRKDKNKPKWNYSSYFIITHVRDANRCADKFSKKKASLNCAGQLHPIRESLKENQNLTLKRGNPDGEPEAPKPSESCRVDTTLSESLAGLPEDVAATCTRIANTLDADNADNAKKEKQEKQEEPVKPEKPVNKASKYDLTGVPEAMKPVAEYLLYKTGRPALTQHEREILREILDAQHTPTRVIKEIAKQVAIKQRKGLNIRQVTFNLIGAILRNQYSHEQAQIRHAANKEAVRARKAALQAEAQANMPKVAAPVLPVEEAERIIAEYVPAAQAKKQGNTGLPVALKELYEGMQKRWEELNGANSEAEVFSEEEYLRLKFPKAKEEDLQRQNSCSDRDLDKAFEHDLACATCTDPETCPFKGMQGRPTLVLKELFGRLGVCSAWTPHNGCKHQCSEKSESAPNPELEERIKKSGLSEMQSKMTFESYNHAGAKPEVVSAKAKAMLAAKNKASLILAGKSGTGKTHLAVSIALEAMNDGRNAIFATAPDMLDELARIDWEHTGIFWALQKYREVPCLVIDDLDKAKLTPKKLEYMFKIIDYRYNRGLQTIITTNAYDLSGLVDENNATAIEPIISRVLNNGEWVTMQEAENYRL